MKSPFWGKEGRAIISENRKKARRQVTTPRLSWRPRLILGHLWIYAICPGQNPAGEIMHLLETRLLQEGHGLRTAHAGAAMGNDFPAGIQLMHPIRQITQRDQMPVNIANLILVRLTHVEHEKVFAGIQ